MLYIRLSVPLTFSYRVLKKISIACASISILCVFVTLVIDFDDINEGSIGYVSWEIS